MDSYNDKGITSLIVFGERNIGKSVYALKVIHDLYHNGFDKSDEEAWDTAVYKTIKGLDMVYKRGMDWRERGEVNPAWQLDDAGEWLGGENWSVDKENQLLMIAIKKLVPTMRKVSAGNIYTCDNPKDLADFIGGRAHNIVKVIQDPDKPDEENAREARIYEKSMWPSMKVTIRNDVLYKDKFNRRIPDWVYKKYDKKREELTDDAFDMLGRVLRSTRSLEINFEDGFINPQTAAICYMVANELGLDVTQQDIARKVGFSCRTLQRRRDDIEEELMM